MKHAMLPLRIAAQENESLTSGLLSTTRAQMPIGLADDSAPEPDIAVAPGARTDYRDAHPAHPVLVVEVAESSLDFDRRDKGSLYARGGIRDYWIVNLVDRVVEVYRDPRPDAAAAYGWSYGAVEHLRPPATIVPIGPCREYKETRRPACSQVTSRC